MRRLACAAIRASARDATGTVAGRSALVIAPHPDDETIGCGATILRKVAAGTPVTVLVVTDGRHSHRSAHLSPDDLAALRRTEMAEAARRLGLPAGAVRWAGLVDGTVTGAEDRLAELIGDLIVELRPHEVYATCADEPHPDHAAVGRAARRAVSAVAGVRLLEYPVWLWSAWPLRRADPVRSLLAAAGMVLRRRAVAVPAGPHGPAKLAALRAHRSQWQRPDQVPPHEPWPTLPADLLTTTDLFFPHGAR